MVFKTHIIIASISAEEIKPIPLRFVEEPEGVWEVRFLEHHDQIQQQISQDVVIESDSKLEIIKEAIQAGHHFSISSVDGMFMTADSKTMKVHMMPQSGSMEQIVCFDLLTQTLLTNSF